MDVSNDLGVAQDLKKAHELYRQAAMQGHANAQFNFGWEYQNGQGVAQDFKIALKLYQLAAMQEFADAQFHLGFMYYYGRGVVQDLKKAFELFQQAAMKGCAKAQNNLGVIYENSRGIAQDVNRAITFYAQAIEGDFFLMSVIIWRCFQQNPKRTLKIEEVIKLCEQCIEKAEINDKKKALTILVEIYQKGIFVSQDLFF